MFKKLSLSLLILTLSASLAANQPVEDYSTGTTRINKIMTNDDTGVAAFNKTQAHYAETQNLTQDLNIPQIAEFFGCKTIIGKSFLTETLRFPLTAQDKNTVLVQRQQAIKILVENPELREKVGTLLKTAQLAEQEVVKLMSDYFIGKTCPELAQLEALKKNQPGFYPIFNFLCTNPTGRSINTTLNILALCGTSYALKVCAQSTYQVAKSGGSYGKLAAYTTYLGLVTGLYSYVFYKDYSDAAEKRLKIHYLNRMIDVAEQLERLCKAHNIKSQFAISSIEDLHGTALLEQIKHARYQNKNTWIFALPLVHTFIYKLYREDKHLAQTFAYIAELDAYNALATKMIESRSTNTQLCFVSFIDAEKPCIKADALWNVLVPKAVPSSIHENRNIILTGPNAGGKTTSIRALLQNIVLGQSFGIAAARRFEYTMFDIIHSYLNVSDDLINGLSLFASEVKRAQDILQRMKTLEPGKKFFFALDELFTGTAAEDGENCAYNFVKRIAEFERVQFTYATHFDKLKELGSNNTSCVNYKVDAPTKNQAGKLVFPYTLSKGASDARIALELAREANLFA